MCVCVCVCVCVCARARAPARVCVRSASDLSTLTHDPTPHITRMAAAQAATNIMVRSKPMQR